MPKKAPNIHDKYMKSILANTARARDFFRQFLPAELLNNLDLDTLSPEKSSFVPTVLDEVFSDAVFNVSLKSSADKECLLSILLEHKSYHDRYAPFQILLYLAEGYREQVINKKPLRPIIPFLFYHGKRKWKLKPIPAYFGIEYKGVSRYVPNFETIFVDMVRMSETEILQAASAWLRAALLTQKYSHSPKELERSLQQILQTLNELPDRNFFAITVVYILRIVETQSAGIQEIIQGLPAPIKEEFMSTYDMIMKEGVKEGIEKGIEKEKTEVVLRGYKNGFSIPSLALITGLSEKEVETILNKNK